MHKSRDPLITRKKGVIPYFGNCDNIIPPPNALFRLLQMKLEGKTKNNSKQYWNDNASTVVKIRESDKEID